MVRRPAGGEVHKKEGEKGKKDYVHFAENIVSGIPEPRLGTAWCVPWLYVTDLSGEAAAAVGRRERRAARKPGRQALGPRKHLQLPRDERCVLHLGQGCHLPHDARHISRSFARE